MREVQVLILAEILILLLNNLFEHILKPYFEIINKTIMSENL